MCRQNQPNLIRGPMSEAVTTSGTNSSTKTSAAAPPAPPKAAAAGLQGVIAAPSAICFIDGTAGRLVYRGYEIPDLVAKVSFEEPVHLLLDEKLPTARELAALKSQLAESITLPPHVMTLLKALPAQAQVMDALRTACSALGAVDPDLTSNDRDANRRKAVRLTAQFPTIVAAFHRLRNKQEPIAPDTKLSIAANFLFMMT